MIKRERINTEINKLIEKNKLEKCFTPIIEEFFFRVADQCNWDEYDFEVAISAFHKVTNINFSNIPPNEGARTNYAFSNNTISVCFDVNQLKHILKSDKYEIENFINNAMHELGHVLQFKRKNSSVTRNIDLLYTGFYLTEIDTKNQSPIGSSSLIINEYAEVVNACRLQNGHIDDNRKIGYFEIQNAVKVALCSLGITDLELANLQFKGRDDYENFVASKLGLPSYKMYIDSFERILDSIWNFSNDIGLRKNLICQVDSLQILSQKLFEDRFENIVENSNDILGDLAKLSIDEEKKDSALMFMFDQFNIEPSELQIADRK